MTKEEILWHLEEILASCDRHPLEIGFNHSNETFRELEKRLENIRNLTQQTINYVRRDLDE